MMEIDYKVVLTLNNGNPVSSKSDMLVDKEAEIIKSYLHHFLL